jgi:hypothetical protein
LAKLSLALFQIRLIVSTLKLNRPAPSFIIPQAGTASRPMFSHQDKTNKTMALIVLDDKLGFFTATTAS